MARTDHYHNPKAPRATRLVPAVSAVITDDGGRIVLHRRRDSGQWSLIGGGIEPGETIFGAIKREIKEETGLNAEVTQLIGIYSDPHHVIEYSDGEVRQQFSICFACKAIEGTLEISDESIDLRSFERGEIEHLNIHPSNKQRIDDFWAIKSAPFIR